MDKITINGNLTSLNEYINIERTNRYQAANIKKKNTEYVYWTAKESNIQKIKERVGIIIIWNSKNRNKDKDNISFAKKFILDGLVEAGILDDDKYDNIIFFQDYFNIIHTTPYIEVYLIKESYIKEHQDKIIKMIKKYLLTK